MKELRRIELEQMLDAALESGDAKRIRAVRRTIDRENLECTAHTAERVKRIEATVEEISKKLGTWGIVKDIAKVLIGAALSALAIYAKSNGPG